MVLLAASSVAACGASMPSAKAPINLPTLPLELTCKADGEHCEPPCPEAALIPDRDISQAEAETLWRKDRAALRTCRNTQNATVIFYQTLQEKLRSPEH